MNRRFYPLFLSIAIMLMLVVAVNAALAAPGTPTLRWVQVNATTAQIVADGIENGGGQTNNGAISWDIYFRVPNSVVAPYPTITAEEGPAWVGLNCGFNATVSGGQPSAPGPSGDRGYFLNGSCTSGFPTGSVTGDNVVLATLTLSGCPASGFIMDLDSGDDVFGAAVAQIVDRSNDPYYFADADLTDGPACGAPTAVTMSNMSANSASPIASSLPLILGGAAVAVGGAVAFLRRKR